jgi:hypothetical protein
MIVGITDHAGGRHKTYRNLISGALPRPRLVAVQGLHAENAGSIQASEA